MLNLILKSAVLYENYADNKLFILFVYSRQIKNITSYIYTIVYDGYGNIKNW